jgi:GH35 family endo-1,4-beta-xylanase
VNNVLVRKFYFSNRSHFMSLKRTAKMLCTLKGIGCFTLILFGSIPFYSAHGEGLKDAAAKVNMYFGAATDRPTSFTSILKNDFSMLVCENAMKWDATERTDGNFSYGGGDAVVKFADSSNMKMRGHTFVWTPQTPSWVQSLNRQNMLAAMKDHILNLGGHWKGKILEWDVVNEMIADGGSGSLKNTYWRQKIGDDFIDSAFVYAHQADPNAYLYINDYSAEGMNTKSNYLYNFVKGMKERGIPVHGVGLQCHLTAPVSKDQISQNIKRFGELGLRVSCTEIDIMNGTNSPSSWTNLVQACVENFNVTSFVVWGVSDANSWRGSGCNCLIWDKSGQVKTDVYNAIKTAFANGDPAIAEKRKAFMGLSPVELKRIGKAGGSELRGVPRFTINNNMLSYYVSAAQTVVVRIVDIRGRTMIDRDLGMQTPGTHTIRLTRRKLPAGLYFAKIRSGNTSVNSISFTLLN